MLEDFFIYNGSGVMPGRTWVIAPDKESLQKRWKKLISAPTNEKEQLFHPHLRDGKLGDKHTRKVVRIPLSGFPPRPVPLVDESGAPNPPEPYAYRSFDRRWIIPDNRLINQPNPDLWQMRSHQQVFMTVLSRTSPVNGPALTVTGFIPDLDHYKGSFGGGPFRSGAMAKRPPRISTLPS
jgi:hypothetical protein